MTDPVHDAYESAHRHRDGAERRWRVPILLEFDVTISAPSAAAAADEVAEDFESSFGTEFPGCDRADIALTTGVPTPIGPDHD